MPTKKKLIFGILVVVVLTAIAGLGWFVLIKKPIIQLPKFIPTPPSQMLSIQEVTITTDRTEYEQGEIIKVTIRNGSESAITYQGPHYCSDAALGLEKLISDNWQSVSLVSAYCLSETKTLNPESESIIDLDLEKNFQAAGTKHPGAGIYRLLFKYSQKTIYSNEFTIK